ncbi:hypothetical protein BD779DRAFT_1549565 [Infundibulicybe gibba]|nr:hypothetical protein BD779DRAFT_1549565 [Infundibulicybe gibba]
MSDGRSNGCSKTVVVLGGAYGGAHSEDWRVILIDRNSCPWLTIPDVYILPRLAVLPGHEHKAFIPYDNVFLLENTRHLFLRAHPTCYREKQKIIEQASSVLVVGGGALGIQFATDIASVHPEKQVTLLHSRGQLLPRFDEAMHSEILQALESMNVDVILGERLDLASLEKKPEKRNALGQRVARTLKGREIAADLLLLCTGQAPNTHLLRDMDPVTIDPATYMAHVLRTLQLGVLSPVPVASSEPSPPASQPASREPESATTLEAALEQLALADLEVAADDNRDDEASELKDDDGSEPEELEQTPYPHIFAVGDAADAFGAIAAGYNAYFQGEVAARNVLRLIRNEGKTEQEPLELYTPGAPAIKVSLGLTKNVYQSNGVIGTNDNNPEDLQAASMWPFFGVKVEDEAQMFA